MISPSGRPVLRRAAQLGIEALLEAAAVEAPGQRIRARHARERLAAPVLVARVPAAQHGGAAEAETRRTRRTAGSGRSPATPTAT